MATIIRDGFDFYGALLDLTQNYWDIADQGATAFLDTANTRFGLGQCYGSTGSSSLLYLEKAIGSNEATLFWAGAFYFNDPFTGTTTSGLQLRYVDNVTTQCTVQFSQDGAIRVYRGDQTGTLLATFTGAFGAQAWVQFQVKVVVDGAAGAVYIRKNGATSDTYSVTGLDLTSTANNFATKVQVFSRFTNVNMDDFWWYTGSGAIPNDFIGDVRAVPIMPNSDNSVAFTPSGATIPSGNQTNTANKTFTANTQITLGSFEGRDGTAGTAILQFNLALTGNIKAAIYDSDGPSGAPLTLLAASNQVTNPGTGQNTFTFASPPTLIRAHTYWLALLSDTSLTNGLNAKAGAVTQYSNSRTYGSGFLSPWTATLLSALTAVAWAVITPAGNYPFVEDRQEDGDLTYVSSSSPGAVDLYGNPGLPITPQSIIGLSVRSFQRKGDAGARSGQVRLKSGATTVDGASVPLGTTYGNVYKIQDVDPNTGVAWTASGILNALFGPRVAS